MSHANCPICGKHRGVGPLAYCFVEPRRHAASWADLTEAEGAAIGRVGVRLARALRAVLEVEQVHTFVAGLAVPHFHQHTYIRPAGTPVDVPWWPPPPVSGEPAAVARRLAAELRTH